MGWTLLGICAVFQSISKLFMFDVSDNILNKLHYKNVFKYKEKCSLYKYAFY